MTVPRPSAPAVLVEPLGVDLETWRAPLLLRGAGEAHALLGDWAGGSRAILTAGPTVRRIGRGAADPALFDALDDTPTGPPRDDGTVGGGWFGMLGYQLGRALEPVGGPPPRPWPLPAGALAYHDHLLRQDRDGTWWLEALVTPGREEAIRRAFATWRAAAQALVRDDERPCPVGTGPWATTPSAGAHAAAVDACVERIAHGDLFQANICRRLSSPLDGDPLDLFTTAWRALRPAKGAYVRGPWGAVASLSPELYLRRSGRAVRSSPIKGTRPRGADPLADADAQAELVRADKDRAEHVMIVDLVRNDLGRVCTAGSVRVSALCDVRAAPGVWHLVSDVEGNLRDDVSDAELLRATFPPGSVTGAPKVAAMRVIHELESTGRECYTGAIGLASPIAGLDLSVAIRTFEVHDRQVWLGVGGGIVSDSRGADEAREAADKAAPLLAAIGAPPFAADEHARVRPLRPTRPGPVPLPRPEPARGVFETVLVRDGEPQRLDEHLARLTASAAALYGAAPAPEDVAAAIGAALRGSNVLPAGSEHRTTDVRSRGEAEGRRLRIDVAPDSAGLTVAAVCTPLPFTDEGAATSTALEPVVVPGGLGAHKWADRRLWDGLTEAAPDGVVPLAVDLDGFVLEASRANVVARGADGVYVTPPLDGRILPGVTRASWLADLRARGATVHERPLPLREVRAAAEIWLTGALRGIEAAVLQDRTNARPAR